ncbi:hypothetical protein [Pedobacter foliorum]|uniref:hypothetical protein n=1 Tax=Pedobacter foliorum TaxID=2739058 RepID=UPI001564884B|nr:hypothetical protein [Pedobacter foliorum]NRF37676.1 hypothetical protein [Pedobacter foliorum]
MNKEVDINKLGLSICAKAGIKYITSGDCQYLSIEISKAVNKPISTTTLKRVFGFAAVKFNFSKHTMTVLCEYIENPKK